MVTVDAYSDEASCRWIHWRTKVFELESENLKVIEFH